MLFNTEMVKAILENRKTQTRRINPDGSDITKPVMELFDSQSRTYGIETYQDMHYTEKVCCVEAPVPVCPGDVLWVRETWRTEKAWQGSHIGYEIAYKAGGKETFAGFPPIIPSEKGVWHPSIHMPKGAARLFLRVWGVRTERLNVITLDDILAEGVVFKMKEPLCWNHMTNLVLGKKAFSSLWDKTIREDKISVNGWDENPWVWVYSFERIEKPAGWPNV